MCSGGPPKWLSLIARKSVVKKKRVADICSNNLGQMTSSTEQFNSSTSNVLREIKTRRPTGKTARPRKIVTPASALELLDYQISSDSESENFVASSLPAACSKASSSYELETLEDYVHSSDSADNTSSIRRELNARQTSNFESLPYVHKPSSSVQFPVIEDDSQVLKGQIDYTVISGSSEEENTPVCDRNQPVHNGMDPAIFFSATEEHPQALFRKYLPPTAKVIRSKLASRLDTLLHRQQSNRVIWLHKKNQTRESDDHEQQIFLIKSIRLPGLTFIRRYSSQVCLLASTEDHSTYTIIFIPSSTLTDEQLNLLRGSRSQRSLEVSLFKPWYELRTPHTLCPADKSIRTIFAPFMAILRPSSAPLPTDEFLHLSVECDCLKKGSTETCPRRYGPQRPNHDSLLWISPPEPATSSFLVLHKSLCWCHHKLRFVFIFNFTGGFLAVFLVPTSVFAAERCGMRRSSCPLSNLGPGCVCEVSDLRGLPQTGDDGFIAKILEHVSSVREMVGPFFEFERSDDSQLHVPKCLLSEKASWASEGMPNTILPFFLLQSGTGPITFKSSLYSEQLSSPPFASQFSPGCRCTLKGVLLHEFPAGSVSAEKIVAAVSTTGEYPDLVPSSSPIVLLVYLLGQDMSHLSPIRILICTRDAATPMAVLNSNLVNFPISFDQQDTCWIRLIFYGVIFFEGDRSQPNL
uniref:Uncharacterized protein n=1 Tax=Schistocephalus solidus TaxID=70667 RepID=A0A0X3P750_SCHSO